MTSAPQQSASKPARRTVIAAAGATGLAVALTACGSGDESSAASSDSTAAGTEESSNASNGGSSGSGSGSGGAEIAKTSDIPEGGGKVFADQKMVITQPTAGEFKAFSSTCTHQGCAVKSVKDGVINCPCHNSSFLITDGSVKSGPATKPLPAMQITVDGDSIKTA